MKIMRLKITVAAVLSTFASLMIPGHAIIAKDLEPVDNTLIYGPKEFIPYPRYSAGSDLSDDPVTIGPCDSFKWAKRAEWAKGADWDRPRGTLPKGRFSTGASRRLPADTATPRPTGGEDLSAQVIIGQKTIAGRDIELSEYFRVGQVYNDKACQNSLTPHDPLK